MLWLASSYNATRQTYCVFVGWFSQPPRSSCSMQQFGQTDETEDVSRAAAWPSYHARSLCSRFTRTVCRPCTLDATCPPGSRVLAAGVLPTAPLRLSSISSFRPTPNAVISAVGYKLRLVFRWLRTLLRQLPLVVLGPNLGFRKGQLSNPQTLTIDERRSGSRSTTISFWRTLCLGRVGCTRTAHLTAEAKMTYS